MVWLAFRYSRLGRVRAGRARLFQDRIAAPSRLSDGNAALRGSEMKTEALLIIAEPSDSSPERSGNSSERAVPLAGVARAEARDRNLSTVQGPCASARQSGSPWRQGGGDRKTVFAVGRKDAPFATPRNPPAGSAAVVQVVAQPLDIRDRAPEERTARGGVFPDRP